MRPRGAVGRWWLNGWLSGEQPGGLGPTSPRLRRTSETALHGNPVHPVNPVKEDRSRAGRSLPFQGWVENSPPGGVTGPTTF